jgi:ABC-2 type transport system permease protein
VVRFIVIAALVLTVICTVLLFFELRWSGALTTTLIVLTFVLSAILLFGLAQDHLTKLLSGLFAVPVGVLGVLSLFWNIAIFPIYVLTISF